MLGLAIDPEFNNNHFVFIYETIVGSNQVVRLKLENDALTQDQIILSGTPASNIHDGGALRFGPDGYLYLGTGDATQPELFSGFSISFRHLMVHCFFPLLILEPQFLSHL